MSDTMNRQQRRKMLRDQKKLIRKTILGSSTPQPRSQRNQDEETALSSLVAGVTRASLLRQHPGSPSAGPRAADFEPARAVLEHFDGMAPLRNAMRKIAAERGDWAGIPMLMTGNPLVVEPTYPGVADLMAYRQEEPKADPDEYYLGWNIRNQWWSRRRRQMVVIFEKDGKITFGVEGLHNNFAKMMNTLGASDAWGIEQEKNAIDTLGGLVRHRQFKQYLLTGTFMEQSKRSGLHYMFRRLRPTLAFSATTGTMRCLAALCLHPIAYYEDSWAGSMCPTDDVIAHLMLMRGDEHMFWKRANQHPSYRPEAGVN